MEAFRLYVGRLDALARTPAKQRTQAWQAEVEPALNGQPSAELRRRVAIEQLRQSGAFFTGAALSAIAVREFSGTLTSASRILDPACGAGDLLLACAAALRRHEPGRSGHSIAKQLYGLDLHHTFTAAARARLALALSRNQCSEFPADVVSATELKGIRAGDGLRCTSQLAKASHIVINPPFTSVVAPKEWQWGNGLVNSAALFVDYCLRNARPGTRIVAILPDVLRSGRRYRKWRRHIAESASILRVRRHHRFARWADVHVFVLSLLVLGPQTAKHQRSFGWQRLSERKENTVGERFAVSVGSVVNFRDPMAGPYHPYIVSKGLAAWKAVSSAAQRRRRYAGTVVVPPFVVIRRTSRPEDSSRAVATIVSGRDGAVVDNHLIVLKPLDGKLSTCRAVLRVLKSPSTSAWLNRRIRCRHLTVGLVRQLPWKRT